VSPGSKDVKHITTPLTDEAVASLRVGDRVLINGVIYTARDAAHKRMIESIKKGEPLPLELKGQILFYTGPSPPKPGMVIGSAGPTTAERMDSYLEVMLSKGVKATIAKGTRSPVAIEAMKRYKAVYLMATGGAGALLSQSIKSAEVIAYEDLGTEAIRKLVVEDFPVVVANDSYGNDIFRDAWKKWART